MADRQQTMAALGLDVDIVSPLIEKAYKNEAKAIFEKDLFSSPHGEHWATCLAGETEIVTRGGIKQIKDCLGIEEILIPKRGKGKFKKCEIRNFGPNYLYRIELVKGKSKKTVYATHDHRWYLKDDSVSYTGVLNIGDKLKSIKSQSVVNNHKLIRFAAAQGFVFGDGTTGLNSSHLDLHHNGKDECMLDYFIGHDTSLLSNLSGMIITRILDLPANWKNLPDIYESRKFLISWLAGYFAADGHVSKTGSMRLVSSEYGNLDFVRAVLSICGISYGKITQRESGKYKWHELSIENKNIPDWFFILDKHKDRSDNSKRDTRKLDWKVLDIQLTTRCEDVYCAIVPEENSFALSGDLLTGNSFHASQFPGDEETACARKAMYGFMNIPDTSPASRKLVTSAESGLDLEDRIVWRLHRAGILLSNPPDADHQTNFTDEKHWLSGNSDAIIKIPRSNRPYALEIKSKYGRVIEEMQRGDREPDPQHVNQLMTYISLIHMYGKEHWPDMDKCMGGSLLYVSRDDPSQTFEFKLKYNQKWLDEGLARLEKWQGYFLDETIPERQEHFMWSKGACQYCPMKREACKKDFKDGITDMSKSHGIAYAKTIRKNYDYKETREAVLERWIKDSK